MAAEIKTYNMHRFEIVQTSLVGSIYHSPSVEERLAEIDNKARTLVQFGILPPEQEGTFRELEQQKLREEVNEEVQARSRRAHLGLPLDPIIADIKKNTITRLDSKRMPTHSIEIFEQNMKQYHSEEERQSWQPRVNLIQDALETRLIFSLSIVPLDPHEEQTWYAQKKTSQGNYITTNYAEAVQFFHEGKVNTSTPVEAPSTSSGSLFDPALVEPQSESAVCISPITLSEEQQAGLKSLMEGLFGSMEDSSDESGLGHSMLAEFTDQYNRKRELPDEPAPVLHGFFAPFTDFSSSLVKPHYDPELLHPTVLVADVDVPSEVEPIVHNLENDAIKTRINRLIASFREDAHAKGMGLMMLEPSRRQFKTLYLKKAT